MYYLQETNEKFNYFLHRNNNLKMKPIPKIKKKLKPFGQQNLLFNFL